MLAWVLVVVAGAAPVKLGAPGLRTIDISTERATFFSETLAAELDRNGVRVVTGKDIAELLGFERQRQLLGCAESAPSCVAELAGALGVDGMLVGDLAKIGQAYQLNVKIISAKSAGRLAAYTGRVDSEEALLDELSRAARALAAELRGTSAPLPSAAPGVGSRGPSYALLGGGGALVAGGLAGLGWSLSVSSAARRQTEDLGLDPTVTRGELARAGTVNALALGATVIGTGLLAWGGWRLLSAEGPAAVLAPAEGGAALVVGGAF